MLMFRLRNAALRSTTAPTKVTSSERFNPRLRLSFDMIEHLVTIIDQIDIIPSAGLALGIYHTIAQSMLEIRAVPK